MGVFQNPIPPPSNAPTGAPSPSRLSYADALRSRPSQPATSTRESGKRKAADDGMSVPRQRPRQSPRKTPIEQEVIEGIDKVRRKQSAEYGEMKGMSLVVHYRLVCSFATFAPCFKLGHYYY